MKSLVFFGFFFLIAQYEPCAQQLTVPFSDYPSGFYTSDIQVALMHSEPGVSIYFTLNGDEPDETDQLYSASIPMIDLTGTANYYSAIPTNPSFTYPVGLYSAIRANNRGWLPPYSEVQKVNIIRYRAYKSGFDPSEIVTQTFVIHPLGSNIYTLPVMSIVFDSYDLFSDDSGIYVYGNHPDGNYAQLGELWEKEGHVEYFDLNGDMLLSGNIESRLHGGGSRSSCKKNFRIYADNTAQSNFELPLFENYDLEKFKRIIIRSGGHRPDCFPRDDISNMLTEGMALDQQHSKQIILFVNGEYWGIHSIKERIDRYFIQNRYNIDDSLVTILNQGYNLIDGDPADGLEMIAIADFVDTEDMTIESNYNSILEKIDIDNYIDYMCSEIFLSNEDWLISNILLWRKQGPFDSSKPKGEDGKFRWILFDMDGAFGGDCEDAFYTVNTLSAATVDTGPNILYSRLFRGLLENLTFRNKFINRMCDLMNSQFRQNRMHEKIDEIYNKLTPEMAREVERWRYPSLATTLVDRDLEVPSLAKWDYNFTKLHLFGNRRQRKVREHFMLKWGFPDSSLVTVDVNDPAMGTVKVNTILINHALAGVNTNPYPWNGYYMNTVELPLVAIPLPGYQFVEWLETGVTEDSISWTPMSAINYTAIFEPTPFYQPILINELMASNGNVIQDNFNDFDDWIELYNPNNYPVNLSGCVFQRGLATWNIPAGTIIGADDYAIFWGDSETYQGENHTNFKLPNSPNTVYLRYPNLSIIDSLYYPSTSLNYSFGRYPNGSNSYSLFSYSTPLQTNNISGVENYEDAKLIVYPNPSNNNVHFSHPVSFKLFDLQGHLLKSGESESLLYVGDLVNGVYVLVSDKEEVIRVVVQK